jgi:hypothetical protein
MPADDLVLNVRQVAGYPPVNGNAPPAGALLIQTAGLGSAYASISPPDLVGTALAQGGDMAIAGALSVQAVSGGSAMFSNASLAQLWAQSACLINLEASYASVGGCPVATEADIAAALAGVVSSFNTRVGAVVLNLADITGAGGAPLASPNFSGVPSAPTAGLGTSTGQLATTAFVQNAVTSSTTGVASFNTRTGAVTLLAADITGAGGAPLASPNFSGVPSAPTAAVGTNTTQVATTAFVAGAGGGGGGGGSGVTTFNGRGGAVMLLANDVSAAGGALLASPGFTGTPSAPTPTAGDNTTRLATTAFVVGAITGAGAGYAPIASPAFTGVPTAPTPTAGTNTTQLATTAFVLSEVAATTAGVASFNARTGVVTLLTNDITAAGGAPLTNPAFTGVPTAPTPTAGTNTTQVATTAFVAAALAASGPFLPLAGGVMTGALTPSQTAGLVGTTAANNVAAGAIGEYLSSEVLSAVALTTNVVRSITLISLTAGDWDVHGVGFVSYAGTGTGTNIAVSTSSTALPTTTNFGYASFGGGITATGVQLATGPLRVSLAATTPIYLVAQGSFSGGAASASGSIRARRVR